MLSHCHSSDLHNVRSASFNFVAVLFEHLVSRLKRFRSKASCRGLCLRAVVLRLERFRSTSYCRGLCLYAVVLSSHINNMLPHGACTQSTQIELSQYICSTASATEMLAVVDGGADGTPITTRTSARGTPGCPRTRAPDPGDPGCPRDVTTYCWSQSFLEKPCAAFYGINHTPRTPKYVKLPRAAMERRRVKGGMEKQRVGMGRRPHLPYRLRVGFDTICCAW